MDDREILKSVYDVLCELQRVVETVAEDGLWRVEWYGIHARADLARIDLVTLAVRLGKHL